MRSRVVGVRPDCYGPDAIVIRKVKRYIALFMEPITYGLSLLRGPVGTS